MADLNSILGEALNIPVGLKASGKSAEEKDEIFKNLQELGIENNEKQQALLDIENKRKSHELMIYKLQRQGVFSPAQTKYMLLRNKLMTEQHKWFVKKKLFETMSKGFGRLGEKAEGWMMTILKFLLFFAFFDPKGKFLKSILVFITNMAVKLIDVLIKWVPMLVQTMAYLFWDVLLPALSDMGETLAIALFGRNSALQALFSGVAQLLPVAVIVLGALQKLSKVVPLITSGIDAYHKFKQGWLAFKEKQMILLLKQKLFHYKITMEQWMWEKKKALWKRAEDTKDWLLQQKRNLSDRTIRQQQWVWEQKQSLMRRAEDAKSWAIEKGRILWARTERMRNWATEKAQMIWARTFKAREWIMEKAHMLWGFAMKLKTFLLDKIIAIAKLISNLSTMALLGIFVVLGTIIVVLIMKYKKQIMAVFKMVWEGIKKFGTSVKNVFVDIINWLKTVVKVGFIDYGSASEKEREDWKKTMQIITVAEKLKKIGNKAQKAEAEKILKATEKEGDFKKFAKAGGLEKKLASLQTAVEKAEEAQNKNTDANKKNTDALLKEKEKALEAKMMKSFKKAGLDIEGLQSGTNDLSSQLAGAF